MLGILSALVVADILTTLIGLAHGQADLNPLFYAQGVAAFLLVKVAFSVAAVPIYVVAYRYLKAKFPAYVKVVLGCLAFMVGFYALIMANNVLVLLRVFTQSYGVVL